MSAFVESTKRFGIGVSSNRRLGEREESLGPVCIVSEDLPHRHRLFYAHAMDGVEVIDLDSIEIWAKRFSLDAQDTAAVWFGFVTPNSDDAPLLWVTDDRGKRVRVRTSLFAVASEQPIIVIRFFDRRQFEWRKPFSRRHNRSPVDVKLASQGKPWLSGAKEQLRSIRINWDQ
jgi:hypothetical protein